ncbi:MAG: flagellar biosynthesis protein FlhF [Firmicutes bacterium ZCTH02-B6]|nr:MAG: flagellar biosynthesis protein FlhF [Firmicutes bacterium ZCTH02-B6]
MRIKRYVANTMQQAIARVKADFGDDAVILHTRRFRRGLFGLLGRSRVEVIAAIDPGRPKAAQRQRELERAREATLEAIRSLQEEVRSLKQMLGEPSAAGERLPAGVSRALARLKEQDLPDEECQALLERALPPGTLDQAVDAQWVWDRLAEQLVAEVPTVPPWDFSKTPVIVPLVGPTGVGKTTTIAKLAANFAMLGKRSVGLVTVDTYRIAAVEHLRAYANIIGLDLLVAYTPDELRQAVASMEDRDLILIDTAGRSQHHAMHMAELRAFLEVLPSPEVHLVLSASTRRQDMAEIVERFRGTAFQRLIITKLDETRAYGSLYMAPRLAGKPLAYLTTGQSVPDDIEVADGQQVARLILGEAP